MASGFQEKMFQEAVLENRQELQDRTSVNSSLSRGASLLFHCTGYKQVTTSSVDSK